MKPSQDDLSGIIILIDCKLNFLRVVQEFPPGVALKYWFLFGSICACTSWSVP